jgi:transposase
VSTTTKMDTTGAGRRRNRAWPEALKREIVQASFAPGSSVSIVARRYDVNANQVFAWRKRFGDKARGSGSSTPLIPVSVTPEPEPAGGHAGLGDSIEIELGGGYRVRVSSGFNAQALRRVLEILEQR